MGVRFYTSHGHVMMGCWRYAPVIVYQGWGVGDKHQLQSGEDCLLVIYTLSCSSAGGVLEIYPNSGTDC